MSVGEDGCQHVQIGLDAFLDDTDRHLQVDQGVQFEAAGAVRR